jgi:hypothetical protein
LPVIRERHDCRIVGHASGAVTGANESAVRQHKDGAAPSNQPAEFPMMAPPLLIVIKPLVLKIGPGTAIEIIWFAALHGPAAAGALRAASVMSKRPRAAQRATLRCV